MFLMVPIVARLVRSDRATQAIDVIIATFGALVGIVDLAMFGYDNLSARPVDAQPLDDLPGVLMLVTGAAVARLISRHLCLAIGRGARVARGAGGDQHAQCLDRRVRHHPCSRSELRLVLIVPIVAAVGFFAPANVKHRDVHGQSAEAAQRIRQPGRRDVEDWRGHDSRPSVVRPESEMIQITTSAIASAIRKPSTRGIQTTTRSRSRPSSLPAWLGSRCRGLRRGVNRGRVATAVLRVSLP